MSAGLYWAPRAWVTGDGRDARPAPDRPPHEPVSGWRDDVLLKVGADGRWAEVTPGLPCPEAAQRLAGPVLPGLVDAHSHAFQRAFAGLAERSSGVQDDFWSWRERMYGLAARLTPDAMRAIAAQLYVELLRGGYTQVCEFHYLHHAPDGKPYADPLEMSWALADAAADAGIGLCLLPVLYERAGFGQPALRDEQRRFASSAEGIWDMQRRINGCGRPLLSAGLAVHSLRAASSESIATLRRLAEGFNGPIHIHVAEQVREVSECLAATGARPIEWLAREGVLDARWQLVHATHGSPEEIAAVARSGAGVVLCPSTEGNLGDGLCDLPGWLEAGVPIAIGSDSQITRAWREELRWLDYGQRLSLKQRSLGVAAGSAAERLWTLALAAGGRAAGHAEWGLRPGVRADLLVVDTGDASLLGVPGEHLLDALVYSSPGRPWRDVMVAGTFVVRDHRHAASERIADAYVQALRGG